MLVQAQLFVVGGWLAVSAVLLGLGLLERRLSGSPLRSAAGLWRTLWMGWALLLAGLQVWHFFLPVDDRARVFFAAVAVLGWAASGSAPWRVLARALPRNIPALLVVVAAAWWLSNQSLSGPRFGDTGMYLIPTVHWYESYAAVPGLANLFVPFGHNLSYFLYAALLDAGPFAGRLSHIVNSALVMVLLARGLVACGRLLRRDNDRIAADLFHVLALVAAIELAFSIYLTSPMPDTGVYLFGLVLAAELVEFLCDLRPSRAAMIRIVFLAAVSLTVKLSIAGLSLAVAAGAVLWWMRRTWTSPADAARGVAWASLAASVPVACWIARNVISSGYPLYPAPLLPLPVDWIARVDATAWIQKPMAMAPMWTIFRDLAWWKTRLLSLGWAESDVMRPLVMIAAGAFAFVVARAVQWWRGQPSPVPVLVLAAPLASFFFSFANTPMPRYQGATLWIFGMLLLVLAFAGVLARAGWPLRALAVVLVLAAAAAIPLARGSDLWLPLKDFEGTSSPRTHTEHLASGLDVLVPQNQVCWYAPLPCTPEPHPGLRLRRPGDLGAGFAIDLPEEP